MNELRFQAGYYFSILGRTGGFLAVGYFLMIFVSDGESHLNAIEWMGKYIGVPLCTIILIWLMAIYFKARKAYIGVINGQVVINEHVIDLKDVKTVTPRIYKIGPVKAWCPGIEIETKLGKKLDYISYYGVSEKNLDDFITVIKKKLNKISIV